MIKQYRPVWGQTSIEFPGGQLNENENNRDAAKRELSEETGYKTDDLEFIFRSRLVSWKTQHISLYHTNNLTNGKMNLDAEEFIEVIKVGSTEFEEMVNRGSIIQGYTIMAYYTWQVKYSSE